jgi:hypothetical protein
MSDIERIGTKLVFQLGDDDRKAKRVKSGVEQLEIVREACQLSMLFNGYLFELRNDCSSY